MVKALSVAFLIGGLFDVVDRVDVKVDRVLHGGGWRTTARLNLRDCGVKMEAMMMLVERKEASDFSSENYGCSWTLLSPKNSVLGSTSRRSCNAFARRAQAQRRNAPTFCRGAEPGPTGTPLTAVPMDDSSSSETADSC